jgi:hypothetical protein
MRIWRCASILILGFLANAACPAENRLCVGGDVEKLSALEQKLCKDQIQEARILIRQHARVSDWHFVVVCGETSWRELSEFSHGSEDFLLKAAADTNEEERTTYLRGAMLTEDSLRDPKLIATIANLGSKPASEPGVGR